MASPIVASFLGRVSRRLRLVTTVVTAQRWAAMAALAVLLTVAVGWLRPWRWPEPAAVVIGVAALVAIVFVAVVRRFPPAVAARVADTNLATHDALTAALEFAEGPAPFVGRIRERAEQVVAATSPTEAVPMPWQPRRWALAALITAAAVTMAVVGNPQDDARAEADAARQAIDAEATRLEQLADEIATDPDATLDELELATELAQLAEALGELDELAAAEELLLDEAPELLRPRDFAQEAAAAGLDRSLESDPLAAGLSGSAAEQLEALGEQLDSVDGDSLEELADRLAALAETQAAGNTAAQAALAQAGQALSAGDTAAAGEALAAAASAQRDGAASVRSGEARRGAASAASDAASRLGDRASGSGNGSGEGQGEGQGQGQGQGEGEGSGNGAGEGQGSGDGQGSGQGGAGGSPSGDVQGGGAGGGQDGQGGQGQSTGGTDTNSPGTELDSPELLLPGGQSDIVAPGTIDTGGDTEVTGLAPGQTNAGTVRVPLADALPQVSARAVEALETTTLPPSQRSLVQSYFDALAGFDS